MELFSSMRLDHSTSLVLYTVPYYPKEPLPDLKLTHYLGPYRTHPPHIVDGQKPVPELALAMAS
jgi:hypothetical protein